MLLDERSIIVNKENSLIGHKEIVTANRFVEFLSLVEDIFLLLFSIERRKRDERNIDSRLSFHIRRSTLANCYKTYSRSFSRENS